MEKHIGLTECFCYDKKMAGFAALDHVAEFPVSYTHLWKPDEDEEDPDMDILKQCQKWHEEDKHQKIVDALEAISAESHQ